MRHQQIYQQQYQNEAVVLASLLENPDLINDCMLQDKHFIDHYHRRIYQLMKHLTRKGEPADYFSIIQLDQDILFKIGGRQRLDAVKKSFLTLENFDFQQRQLLSFHATEQSREQARHFLEKTETKNQPEEIQTLIRHLETFEGVLSAPRLSFKDQVQHRLMEHMNSPKDGISGVNTGFRSLDFFTDGWQRKKLHVIGARPSVGKTAFMLNGIVNSAKENDLFATVFSLETSAGDLIDRMIASESRIDLKRVKNINRFVVENENMYNRYIHASQKVSEVEMDIREHENTVNEMRAVLRQNKKEFPNHDHVVFIDYLTLIKEEGHQNKHLEVESYTNGLKKMGKDFNVPVIALAQLSRGVEGRSDKRPYMSDLRESGAIEQVADMIAFLHRDDYQDYDQAEQETSEVSFIIAKNRDGKTGNVLFRFDRTTQQFFEVAR